MYLKLGSGRTSLISEASFPSALGHSLSTGLASPYLSKTYIALKKK
jgi:hypothetical protein